MNQEQAMLDAFQETGRRYGFVDIEASYYPFKEFKTTWQRIGSKASFKVTDYLMGAEEEVLRDFAACLFTRIQRQRREVYTPRVRDFLRSEEFVKLNQEKGITIILVTHEADIAVFSKRSIRFLDGKVTGDEVKNR